jgi:hypothetical protein
MHAVLILAALGLAAGIPAARAGETLSTETLLAPADAGKSEFYPGGKDAYYPGAAFGKDTYLVAWQAGRMQEGDIVACRVGKDGKVLDDKPFAVSAAKDDQERPKVAFGGGVFLVVWSDLRNEKDYDVYAARVTPEGKVLDADGLLISGGAHNQVKPKLAFDGENFIVAWQDFRNNKDYQIYYARVSAEGKVLDPEGVAITKIANNVEPAVASPGGGRSLVMFVEHSYRFREKDGYDGVFLQNGKPAAERVAPHLRHTKGETAPKTYTSSRSLAAGKNGYLLAYRNYTPAGRAGLDVNANCEIIHPDGKRDPFQTLSGKPHRAIDPEVVWDGSAYVAAWFDPTNNQGGGDIDGSKGIFSRIYASRLDENGKVLTPPGQPIQVAGVFETPAQRVALATDGAGTTLIAYEKHPEKSDVPIKIGFRMLTK